MAGHGEIAVAAGGENFSRVPYLAHAMRRGAQRGPAELVDRLDYIYRCSFTKELMGDTAENLAERFGHAREAMDDWGFMSQQRAGAAMASGFLARQIVPVEVPDGRRDTRLFEHDEFPRPQVTRKKLATLKPAFRHDRQGRVTSGNSSGVTDGAAALLVAGRRAAERAGIPAQARFVDWAVVGVVPEIMGAGPVPAIRKLLQRTRLTVADIDYWEINEAFAVVNLHAEREPGIPRDRTNLYGGGISIGHPPGATGLRMTITAMQHLADSGGRYGVISMCPGSGMGVVTLIENLQRWSGTSLGLLAVLRIDAPPGRGQERGHGGDDAPDEEVQVAQLLLQPAGAHAGQHHAQRHESRCTARSAPYCAGSRRRRRRCPGRPSWPPATISV